MNPVKLKFRHGGEMLVSPIGLRFVEDPEHGPLVLIPELPSPKAYQLDMTLKEAEQAYRDAASMQPLTNSVAVKLEEVEKKLELLGRRQEAIDKKACSEIVSLHKDLSFVGDLNLDRWKALKIHLGLPEGWEHLHEGAAEVKGALVSQAEEIDQLQVLTKHLADFAHRHREEIDALRDELNAIKEQNDDFAWGKEIDELKTLVIREKVETGRRLDALVEICNSTLGELSLPKEEASLFTLAERVGELEESRRAAFQRLCDAELRLHSLEDRHRQMTNEAEGFRRDVENDRVCVQRQSIHPHLPSHWSAAKPKSAWKPLGFLHDGELGRFLVRDSSGGDFSLAFRRRCGEALVFEGRGTSVPSFYEFCPIPE